MLIEVLGVEIDLQRDKLRLSPAKRDRYGKQVASMRGRSGCARGRSGSSWWADCSLQPSASHMPGSTSMRVLEGDAVVIQTER